MMVRVKICGVRSMESAMTAVEAGADYLGFNFVPTSKRQVDQAVAKEIIEEIRGKINIVGVFKDQDIRYVNKLALELGLDMVQLHGKEDSQFMNQVKKVVIKAITFPEEKEMQELVRDMYNYQAHYYLVDRIEQGKGKPVDREKTHSLAQRFTVFLAGGLTPDNVSAVINDVRPFGVDVAGGIETNGKEDLEKIKMFVKNAKGATL